MTGLDYKEKLIVASAILHLSERGLNDSRILNWIFPTEFKLRGMPSTKLK